MKIPFKVVVWSISIFIIIIISIYAVSNYTVDAVIIKRNYDSIYDIHTTFKMENGVLFTRDGDYGKVGDTVKFYFTQILFN